MRDRHHLTPPTLARACIACAALGGCTQEPPGGTSEGTDTATSDTATAGATIGADESGGAPCEVALQGVPGSDADCPEPGFFGDVCGDQIAQLVIDSTTVVAAAPETQEAEISIVDFSLISFMATIESTWSNIGTTSHCVVAKKIRVYERVGDGVPSELTVEPPGGPMASNEDLESDPDTPGALVWFTDPYVAVSAHGTHYLSVLKAPGIDDTGDGADCGRDRIDVVRDYDNEVQLWVRGPSGGPLRKVATVEDVTEGLFYSDISDGYNESNPLGSFLDHPRVAAWADDVNDIDRVVVTWTTGDPGFDRFVTLECSHEEPVECAVVLDDAIESVGVSLTNVFPNPTFDEDGNLYIARRGTLTPRVQQFMFGGTWSLASEGGPPAGVSVGPPSQPFIDGLAIDITPGLWVGRIGQATTPSVFLAWTGVVQQPDSDLIDARVLLSAAHSGNLEAWIEPTQMREAGQPRSNEWGPEVRANGADPLNFVDVAFLRGPQGDDTVFLGLSGDDPAFSPWLTRFRAHDLSRFGEVSIAVPGQEVFVDDVPQREPGASSLFAGEYLGLTQDAGARALVGWPVGQGPGSLGIPQPDLGLSVVSFECVEP